MQQYRWFAVYTHLDEEMLFLSAMQERGVVAYLPMRRFWQTDGKKRKIAYEPLFKCHVFVRTTTQGLQTVKEAPGYSHMVRHGKYLAAIPESHIVKIKTILHYYEDATSCPNNRVHGVPVAVVSGNLQGMVGFLDDGEGQRPIAMEIGQLGQSVMVEVPMNTVVRTVLPTTV